MAIDIATLAIKIQSQEAERNLRTFNELLSLSSHTAKKMEKVSIEVDANGALAQLRELKAEYRSLAASAKSAYAEMESGSTAFVAPATDAENLNALKDFFASTAEMTRTLREEMTQFNESLRELEANSVKTATAGGAQTSSMSQGITVSREYSAALKELSAAQREMEKAAAQADAAMKATVAADEDAAAVKKRLRDAQKELAKVSRQLAETHRTWSGDIIGLSEKEEELKNKVAELKSVYAEAKAAAEKFNQKLEASAEKADLASAKYNELKAKVEAMPKPVAQVTGGVDDFSKTARGAATQATKMARGFNAVAYSAGAAVPGLNKIGQVIGTFAYAGPVVGGIVVGVGALAAGIKHLWEESQRGYRLAHEHAVQAQKDFQDAKSSIADLTKEWNRLGELDAAGALTNEQNAEAARIIEHLTDVYGDLGLGIDAATRKLKGYSLARAEANAQDREHEIRMAKAATKEAQDSYEVAAAQLANIGAWYEDRTTQRETIQYHLETLKKMSPRDAELYLHQWKQELRDASRGKSGYRWRSPHTGEWSDVYMNTGDAGSKVGATAGEAEEELKMLEDPKTGLIAAYERLKKAKQEASDLEIKPQAVFNTQRKLWERQGMVFDKKGRARLLTAVEMYERQKREIQSIEKTMAAVRAKRGETDPEYLRLEADRAKILYTVLKYEEKITREKERQEEREREAIALQEKIANLKKSYTFYTDGKVEKKDSTARDADRKMEMTRYEDLSKSVNERTRTEAQYRLMGLQIEQLNADEQNNRARKQWEKGRSRFVYDRKGNPVREKTDAELAADRKKEIAAAEAKAAKYTRGSTEWYEAMAELDRLRQEDFKKRQETSFANLGFSQIQAHNNMTQAVEARSSQALRLETRNFSKPDNAWKKIEATQSQFYNLFRDTVPSNIESLTNSVNSMKEKLVQV
ncbi:MAG: hypothetical protein IJT50_12525 [Lentisphaeria bacterium]|nr:hypothetical protein [Lentisphaeria bacterium]